MGELKIEDLDAPESVAPFAIAQKKETRVQEQSTIDFTETTKRFNTEMNEIRADFFKKIEEIQEQFGGVYTKIYNLENKPVQELDEATIIAKVLQKVPTSPITTSTSSQPQINEEDIISKVLARVPSGGSVVYEVAPLEKIKKDFLEEARAKILSDISSLNDNAKKALKYLESIGKSNTSQLATKCFLFPNGQGGNSKVVIDAVKELDNIQVAKIDTKNGHIPKLKERIGFLLLDKEATPSEINQVYDHILMEMLQ